MPYIYTIKNTYKWSKLIYNIYERRISRVEHGKTRYIHYSPTYSSSDYSSIVSSVSSFTNPSCFPPETNTSSDYISSPEFFFILSRILSHSALSCNFSLAEILASLSLQDGVTKWYYFPKEPATHPPIHPPIHPPDHMDFLIGIVQ